jgi:hypothetical protein
MPLGVKSCACCVVPSVAFRCVIPERRLRSNPGSRHPPFVPDSVVLFPRVIPERPSLLRDLSILCCSLGGVRLVACILATLSSKPARSTHGPPPRAVLYDLGASPLEGFAGHMPEQPDSRAKRNSQKPPAAGLTRRYGTLFQARLPSTARQGNRSQNSPSFVGETETVCTALDSIVLTSTTQFAVQKVLKRRGALSGVSLANGVKCE